METRLKQLDQLHSFVEGVDKDVTLILQNLQWDRKRLLSNLPMVTCSYNNDHQLPPEKVGSHHTKCFIKLQGYSEDEEMLPEPLDNKANTLVKLSTQQINTILNEASKCNPMFKRGNNLESQWSEPCSLARLQVTYTGEERRAVHDAVVQAVPACHDLTDLALPGCNDEGPNRVKTRVEILAELRDMRRRRTKYRQAAKTRNYSHTLRDVIKTQMESYSGTSQFTEQSKNNNSIRSDNNLIQNCHLNQSSTRDRGRETYITSKDVRGEHPSKYYESLSREANRYNSATYTNYNSKRHQMSGSERQQTDQYHSYRDNYKSNKSTAENAFEYKSRDKHTSSSHKRYKHKEYRSNDRSERNMKQTQTRNSYSRKRNRESYTSDESEDSRTTDREYRRKSHRNRRSPNYNDNYRSRADRTHIKLERSPVSHRPGRRQSSPAQTYNKNSEFQMSIKKEKVNSPDMTEKQDNGNTSRPIIDTNSGTSALIKVEKAEPDPQYTFSRSNSRSSDYTEDKTRESDITIKRENVQNKDKRIEKRQEKSGYCDSTSTNRELKNSSRRVVYFDRNSERQHRYRDSSNCNRYDVDIKEEYTETNNKNDRNVKNLNKGLERTRSERHGRSASSDTEEHRHDKRHDKYSKENNSNDIRKDYRTGHSNRLINQVTTTNSTRCDVTDKETTYDEIRKWKKYV